MDTATVGPPIIWTSERTRRIQTACGSINIIYAPNKLCFIHKGRGGTCLNSMCEGMGRLASELIREGKVEVVIAHLKDIQCSQPYLAGTVGETKSCADAIAKVLNDFVEEDKTNASIQKELQTS